MGWFSALVIMGIGLLVFFVWLEITISKAKEDEHQ